VGSSRFNSVTGGGSKLKWLLVAVGLVLAAFFSISGVTYISPGHVGIIIRRTGGGVDKAPLGPGLHMINPATTGVEEYPTFMQTLVLTRAATEGSTINDEINVNSVEGQPLSLDVSMSFELDGSRVPALYTTFRTDIETIKHGYVKQTIRQALQEVVGNEEISAIIGPKKAEATARVTKLLEQRLATYGIMVKQFTINELRAPTAVMTAIGQKNVMQQDALTAQNALQKNTFEAQADSIRAAGRAKSILAEAEAQAKANRMLGESLTATLVQYELMKKWDGKLPQVSGGSTPLISLPAPR
jgi:regulator of protease activity HflC (stomatin/prohibitin superfamily)